MFSQHYAPFLNPRPMKARPYDQNGMSIAKIEILENDRIDRDANSITRIFPNSSQSFQQEPLELSGLASVLYFHH